MAKQVHSVVLDQGPNFIKSNCNKMAVISAYTSDDSYAFVNPVILSEATMAIGDFTLASSGSNRTLTTASGQSDTSANATGTASHIEFVDTVNSKVLWVTSETSGQSITSGNTVNWHFVAFLVALSVSAYIEYKVVLA